MLTKHMFEVNPRHCVHYLGLQDKLMRMDMTEFEPSKLGTKSQ